MRRRALPRPPWPPTQAGLRALGVAATHWNLGPLSRASRVIARESVLQLELEFDRFLASVPTFGALREHIVAEREAEAAAAEVEDELPPTQRYFGVDDF